MVSPLRCHLIHFRGSFGYRITSAWIKIGLGGRQSIAQVLPDDGSKEIRSTASRANIMSETGTLNIDALFPCNANAALEALKSADSRTEIIKVDIPPGALQLSLRQAWLREDAALQPPDAGGFQEATHFRHSLSTSAEVRICISQLRWEAHAADWAEIWLTRTGHRRLYERRIPTPNGDIPDVLSIRGKGRNLRIFRTTALRNGVTLFVVQSAASPQEFEPLADEIMAILASARITTPSQTASIEAFRVHPLVQPAARFSHPISWKAVSRSCLSKPRGDAALLAPGAPEMGPALIGIETAPSVPGFDVDSLREAVRRGLNKKGLVFGDPRIADGPATPWFPSSTTFESSGMTDSVSVSVSISVLNSEQGLAAIWCIAPSAETYDAANVIARRAFEIIRDSFQFAGPSTPVSKVPGVAKRGGGFNPGTRRLKAPP